MISSVQNPTIKALLKLKQKKYRQEERAFLVEGEHLVSEALRFGRVKSILYTARYHGKIDLKESLEVSEHVLEKLAFSKNPQPIMAVCQMHEPELDLHQAKRLLLLDNVQDPGNVGTMIRTALAFDFDGLILSSNSVDLYNDKLVRSTQGALFSLPIIQGDLAKWMECLKQASFQIYATALHEAKPLAAFPAEAKMAFVMGNEGNGVSQEIQKSCDGAIYIPIVTAESLNVAIAAGIIMHHYSELK